jgi:hypothetical protein
LRDCCGFIPIILVMCFLHTVTRLSSTECCYSRNASSTPLSLARDTTLL